MAQAHHPRRSLLIGTFLLATAASAQTEPLILTTEVLPPYSASYVDYFTGVTTIFITINNTSQENRSIYLAGSLATIDESVSAVVDGGTPWSAPPLEVPPGVHQFTGGDLQPFVAGGDGNVQLTGITQDQITAGVLPEGEYRICLRAFDYTTNEVLSAPEPLGCSNIFSVEQPAPPFLIAPACGELVTPADPQLVLFTWQSMNGISPTYEYHFRLVRIWDQYTAYDALQASTDVVLEETVSQQVLLYNQTKPALIPGQMYAWWVQVQDMAGETIFLNDGYSLPCTFTYMANDGAGFEMTYPFPGDTLPWTMIPVITKFQPHPTPAQTGRFHSRLQIGQDGAAFADVERKAGDMDILWNSGPFLSQRYLLQQAGIYPGVPFDEEMSHHINVYERPQGTGTDFNQGHTYTLDADLRINTYDETDVRYGDASSYFQSGMGVPRLLAPASEAYFPVTEEALASGQYDPVALNFRTAEPPVKLLPPFPIYLFDENGTPLQTGGRVKEMWRLVVFKEASDGDDHTALERYGTVGATLDLLGLGQTDTQRISDSLYKELTVEFQPQDTGWYWWQVSWMSEARPGAGLTPYLDSEVRRFHVGTPGVAVAATQATNEPVRQAECLAECRMTPTLLVDRVAVTSTAVGDTISVGLFRMRITSIVHSGMAATGEALMDVPVMKAQLRVAFSNAHINAKKRLYDGVVNGLYDNSGVIPAGWTVGGSMAAGFHPAAAAAIDDYLQTGGRLVSQLTGNQPMGLPIGIDKELPDGRIVIGILGMQFTDTIARLNAGMALPLHGVGEMVGMGNMSIPFHPGGVGDVSEEATLYVLGDVNVGVAQDTLRIKGAQFVSGFTAVQDSGTFVAWDCKGFRALTIDAEWRFSKDHLREDLANGEDGPDKIIASMKTRVGRAGLFGRVDFNKPFHIDGMKGWGFDVQEAWLDLASYMNPPDMDVPLVVAEQVGLADPQTGVRLPTWEGFYLKRAVLSMPPTIERTGSNDRTSLVVQNMIANGSGFTASIRAANIIGSDEGTLGGWGFSIDTLQLDIVDNSIYQAGFGGRIHLPITDTLLAYSAMVVQDLSQDDKYIEFLLHPMGTIEVPMWVAQMDLLETSYLRAVLAREDTAAFAKAVLNGKLTIDGAVPGLGWMNFRDIAFQGLMFQTADPYTNIDESGVFSLASPQKYMGGSGPDEEDAPLPGGSAGAFPISVTRVGVERRNLDGTPMAGIGFDINLNLSGNVNIFTATTRIAVLGTLNTTALHQWGHHSVELDSIDISGETGAVKIQGGLRWYNGDATYGDGINGSAHAWFLKGALEVAAAVQFGNKNGMRYWFADAMVAKDGGFAPGNPFNIYGFGGGAWYHMKQVGDAPSALQVTNAELANQSDEEYTPGLTLSAIRYVPDAATNFGFKATVIFGDGASGRAYNGDLTAGMTFSASGGVSNAFLNGNVYLMCARDANRDYVPIWGDAHISFDFPNDIFNANFSMHVKLAGGSVTGTGTNDLAGAAEIYVTPDTWHFFVGTPQTPVGLDFIGLFDGGFYFMLGKDLPPAEPPRDEILALLPPGFFQRDDMDDARRLAFGSRTHFGDDFKFFLLRMKLEADFGFDMAFADADQMICQDIADPGIWGWYATGNMYAYLAGGVSLYIDLWFASGEYDIFDVAGAAMLRGAFANPTHLKGAVGGHYSILGGAVDGNFSFPFEMGSPCEDPGDGALSSLDPIGDLVPHNNEGMSAATLRVDVGVQPEATMNIKLNMPFTMNEVKDNGSRVPHTYRLSVAMFELRKQAGNVLQACNRVVKPTNDLVILEPVSYLEPNTVFVVSYSVKAEERVNGEWQPAKKPNGTEQVSWTVTHTFKSGAGVEKLRQEDLDYTYPLYRQRFVLQNECRSGIIQCRADLSDQPVFDPPAGRGRRYRMAFTPKNGGAPVFAPATVEHFGKSRVLYQLPNLQNSTVYVVQLVGRDSLDISQLATQQAAPTSGQPTTAAMQPPQGAMMSTLSTSTSQEMNGMVNVQRRQLSGYTVRNDERILYEYQFRTSAHNSISEKTAAMTSMGTEHTSVLIGTIREHIKPSFGGEGFDTYDVNGFAYGNENSTIAPLIRFTDARTDPWNNPWAKPLMYDYYQMLRTSSCTSLQLERTTTVIDRPFPMPDLTMIQDHPDNFIGIPPYKTVSLYAAYVLPILSNGEALPFDPANLAFQEAGSAPTTPVATSKFYVGTASRTRDDHVRLQTITADALVHCNPNSTERYWSLELEQRMLQFQASTFKPLYRGNYGIKASFRTPPSCDAMEDAGQTESLNSGNIIYPLPTGATVPLNTQVPGAGTQGAGTFIQP